MIFCTTIEAQIVFETLLVLITSQLAIAGQLGSEVHLWRIRLFLGVGDKDDLEKGFMMDKAAEDRLPYSRRLWQG